MTGTCLLWAPLNVLWCTSHCNTSFPDYASRVKWRGAPEVTSRVVFRVTARRAGVCPLFSLPSTCQCQSQARRWASKTWNTWQGHVPVLGVCRSNKEVAQTPECFHLTGRGLPVSFTHIPSGWEGRCICNILHPRIWMVTCCKRWTYVLKIAAIWFNLHGFLTYVGKRIGLRSTALTSRLDCNAAS